MKKGKEQKQDQGRTKKEKRERRREIEEEHWVDHQTEERLFKKLKRGKITQAEYDELVGEISL